MYTLSFSFDNRDIIDKRRPHLIDIYAIKTPNIYERVATYNVKSDTLTFYHFNELQYDLWSKIMGFRDLMPYIKPKIKGE